MHRLVVATFLGLMVFSTGAEAQRSRLPPIPLRVIFERGPDGGVSTLNVEIRNIESNSICVSTDYAAPARLVMTQESAIEVTARGADAAVQPGCVELVAGATLNASYDVRALFPDQDLGEPRLCYRLPLRSGAANEADGDRTLHWSACSRARR